MHPSKPWRTTSALTGLRATKAIAQAFSKAMDNLAVLECHLYLEIKDPNKAGFLDSPIYPTGLFDPAVDGFEECFSAAQKSSQAMCHILPKLSSFFKSQECSVFPATREACSIYCSEQSLSSNSTLRRINSTPFLRTRGPAPE